MIKVRNIFYYFLVSSVLFFIACNKPESIELDFLNSDWILSKGVDTFTLIAKPLSKDTIVTYSTAAKSSSMVVGILDDPMFGHSKSEFNTQIHFTPEKDKMYLNNVDSVVLSLRYDTSTFYGLSQEPISLEVYKIDDALNYTQTYYNNSTLKLGKKIGEKLNFIPNKKDSLYIKQDTNLVRLFPQLRIQLDKNEFISTLNSLPDTALQSLDTFVQLYGGISLRPVGNTKGMLGFLPENADSKITIFYSPNDSTHLQFSFNMGADAVKFTTYETDRKNTAAKKYETGEISPDSLIFIQAFNGPEAEIIIPYSNSWDGKFLNYAVLDFTVASLPMDDISHFYPSRLFTVNDLTAGYDGEVKDCYRAKGNSKFISIFNDYRLFFGGTITNETNNGNTTRHYKMNITEHFRVSQRQKKDIRIRVSSYFKNETADRTILYGPKHSLFPAKLRLTFSE